MSKFNNEGCLVSELSEKEVDKLIKILPNSKFFWSGSFNKTLEFN